MEAGNIEDILNTCKIMFGEKSDNELPPSQSLPHQIINYYESIIRFMPGNVYWIDKNCITLGCNKNVLDMFGFESVSQFRGLSFEQMAKICHWSKEAEKKFRQDTLHVLNTGEPILNTEEPSIKHSNGRWQYFLTSRMPIYDKQKAVIGVVGISIDITDKKEADQLRLEKYEAEQQTRLVEIFASSIAHELRTPLSSIRMGMSGLEKYLPNLVSGYNAAEKNEQIDKDKQIPPHKLPIINSLCERAQHQADYALFFIDMSLTNIRHKAIDNEKFITISMIETINDSLQKYPLTDEERNRIIWQAENNTNFEYYGEPVLTIHVLFNLIKNALYYTHTKKDAKIIISLERGDNRNCLRFKDTGAGIPAEVLPSIFQAFYTRRTSGSGVGLAFCKMVMESYGGDIRCESQEGEYTSFILEFPIVAN